MLIINLYDSIPDCKWEGKERVFAIVGSQYRNFVFVESFHEVLNSSTTPEETFEVLKRSLLSANIPRSATVVGFAHTHPPREYHPSDADIEGLRKGFVGAVICEGIAIWYDSTGEQLSVSHMRF